MDPNVSLRSPAPGAARWKRAVGYLVGVACLVWVFHDIHVEGMFQHIGAMNWWWVIPAVVCDLASYVCEGVRWQYLLRPVGNLTVIRATEAIYVGLFANEVTPMRFGELVRTYLASLWMGKPIAQIVPSMLVSRLIDGIWLALCVGLVAVFVPLPRELVLAGDIMGAAVVILVVGFLFLILAEPAVIARWAKTERAGRGILNFAKSLTGRIGQGLVDMGNVQTLLIPAIFSLGILVFQAFSFWFVMRAYRLQLPFLAGAAVYLVVHFGTAIPNAPANVGAYQFFTVLGLGLFGVDKTEASGFSVVVFIILTLPLWALGLVALSRSGLTLATIREDIKRTSWPPSSP